MKRFSRITGDEAHADMGPHPDTIATLTTDWERSHVPIWTDQL